jgi:hypothetical protein
MKKLVIGIIAGSLMVLVGASGALAGCENSGYCPKGTCANNGGNSACDVKNCAARNCKWDRKDSSPGSARPQQR